MPTRLISLVHLGALLCHGLSSRLHGNRCHMEGKVICMCDQHAMNVLAWKSRCGPPAAQLFLSYQSMQVPAHLCGVPALPLGDGLGHAACSVAGSTASEH